MCHHSLNSLIAISNNSVWPGTTMLAFAFAVLMSIVKIVGRIGPEHRWWIFSTAIHTHQRFQLSSLRLKQIFSVEMRMWSTASWTIVPRSWCRSNNALCFRKRETFSDAELMTGSILGFSSQFKILRLLRMLHLMLEVLYHLHWTYIGTTPQCARNTAHRSKIRLTWLLG